MTTREYRLLDRVSFGGRTTLQQDDTSLQADQIDVAFSVAESWRGVQQSIDHVVGLGNVLMNQGGDRLTCDKMDIAMGAGPDGKASVKSATATGSVSALQGDRSLQATDKLIVDFEAAPGRNVVQAADSGKATPSAPISGPAVSEPLKFSSAASPRRLRAFGKVSVIDPSQSLDLSCEQLDCTIAAGKDIESAVLGGLADRPASVKLDTFSVTGKDITLDVVSEWADVPGEGRMTIQSQKDLDGRKVEQPIPIVVTWTDGMKYRGRENRADFSGNVHASSQTATTFDCASLLVEFEDAIPAPAKTQRGVLDSWGIRGPLSALWPSLQTPSPSVLRGFTKEPRYIEATGNAVAQTAELHPTSGTMKSRARISGPKLSLHLRSELSKLLIEGPGDLLLEDFQPAKSVTSSPESLRTDLFSDESDDGPSKTLIKWRDRMWYDFGIDQTLFEGDVQLKHFSGAELDKVFGVPQGGTRNTAKGRRTFLNSDALTVDFTDAPRSTRRPADQRMGRISSDRLRRFRANGRVALREEVDQFSLNAEEVIYERPRKILLIHGAPQRKAQLIRQRPGKLPDQMAAERIFYNLETGKIEISRPQVKTGQ
jgi:lipopolysaccharide export system protein LptA